MREHADAALLAAGGLLSLLFLIPLLSRNYQFERWSRLALVTIILCTLAWAALGFVDQHIGSQSRWHPLSSHIQSMFGGAAAGVLVVLILSREFSAARQRRNHLSSQ